MSLVGKTALITGAQQGIGRATVLAIANAGADVAINWFDDELAAEVLAREVRRGGRRAVLVQGNVAVAADVARIVNETVAALGAVDILA